MTKRIAIVTDSTADLPPDTARELGITVIPLTVNFGLQQYQDGVDITSEDFYPMLAASPTLPTSSQPSPAEFQAVYERLLQEHDSIISIHISSGLSGTINAALTAKEMVDGDIHVVDSKSVSLGIGIIVLEAREMVEQGLGAAEIVARLEPVLKNTEVFFTLDTLEYLHKGGRIGKVAAVMGSLLNIKPIVRVVDGVYIPVAKVRRQEQALQEMVEQFKALASGREIKRLVVAHGAAEPAATRLASKLKETLGREPDLTMSVGPVIGVHTGPGTVGAAMILR
ncbi:MAG TPA: DegV family protein [Firmicutes bacterium]|nr:DegV family protein [Bacillota bacterium]